MAYGNTKMLPNPSAIPASGGPRQGYDQNQWAQGLGVDPSRVLSNDAFTAKFGHVGGPVMPGMGDGGSGAGIPVSSPIIFGGGGESAPPTIHGPPGGVSMRPSMPPAPSFNPFNGGSMTQVGQRSRRGAPGAGGFASLSQNGGMRY